MSQTLNSSTTTNFLNCELRKWILSSIVTLVNWKNMLLLWFWRRNTVESQWSQSNTSNLNQQSSAMLPAPAHVIIIAFLSSMLHDYYQILNFLTALPAHKYNGKLSEYADNHDGGLAYSRITISVIRIIVHWLYKLNFFKAHILLDNMWEFNKQERWSAYFSSGPMLVQRLFCSVFDPIQASCSWRIQSKRNYPQNH